MISETKIIFLLFRQAHSESLIDHEVNKKMESEESFSLNILGSEERREYFLRDNEFFCKRERGSFYFEL